MKVRTSQDWHCVTRNIAIHNINACRQCSVDVDSVTSSHRRSSFVGFKTAPLCSLWEIIRVPAFNYVLQQNWVERMVPRGAGSHN